MLGGAHDPMRLFHKEKYGQWLPYASFFKPIQDVCSYGNAAFEYTPFYGDGMWQGEF